VNVLTDACVAIFSITSGFYKILLDELKAHVHLGNVMSFLHQITKTAKRAAFAGDCAVYRSFGGNDVCLDSDMQELAISSRHLSRSVELTTWRRT
jgi:hypothetical protein